MWRLGTVAVGLSVVILCGGPVRGGTEHARRGGPSGAGIYAPSTLGRSGTPAGAYAASLVSRQSYETIHRDQLFTHAGDNRMVYFGVDHDPARDNILALFASYGLDSELSWFETSFGLPGCNVVAERRGTTRPGDVYIIGAHYDSISSQYQTIAPGADDNASGVAAVVEIARLTSQWPTEATLRFIAFDFEEEGLLGAEAYANAHLADNIRGMISLDMVSFRSAPHDCVSVFGRDTSSPVKEALGSALADYGGLYAQIGGEHDHSDHAPFEWVGFQAALLIEDNYANNPYYHLVHDHVDQYAYIDYEYALANTRGVLGWLVDQAGITPAHPIGDSDCDYGLTSADIDAFVLALAGEEAYHAVYPACPWLSADTNGDGLVNFGDIDALVEQLTAGSAIPELVGKLGPGDAAVSAQFGNAIALAGDTLVIGAYADDELGLASGATYVYERIAEDWTQVAKLTHTGGVADDCFGWSLAIDDDALVVGVLGDDAAGLNAGAVEVFERSGTDWTSVATLRPADLAAGDGFGLAAAIDGDTAAVGAPYADNDGLPDCGAAYVFRREAGVWTQVQKIVTSEPAPGDSFGYSVALRGATLVIGTPGDDDAAADSGAVSVFELVGGTWVAAAKLLPEGGPAGEMLGMSVALDGATAVVSGFHGQSGAGSACVFERTGSAWAQVARLGPWWQSGPLAVAISGDALLLGRPNGNLPGGAGQAVVYRRVGETWTPAGKLAAWDGVMGDQLGFALALDGDTCVVGSPWADGMYIDCGAAYVGRLSGAGGYWTAE